MGGKTTVKTDRMGRSTIYVQPTFWAKEKNQDPTIAWNFMVAFEGEKGTEATGLKVAKGDAKGYGATSPCMIDDVFTKCGSEYMTMWKPMTAKIDSMKKMAALLTTDAEKKAFWAKAKADPKVVAEWKGMKAKSAKLFKEDKKTWETTWVDSDKKEGKWLTFLSIRKFRTTSEVSKMWKRSEKRKFSLSWSDNKGNSAYSQTMELMMSDSAMTLAASATVALSALTLM